MKTSSAPSAPFATRLDLATITQVQQVVVRALRDQVCQWEQDSLDAGSRGEYSSAQTCKQWAFAADLCATYASSACSAVFMEAIDALNVVSDYRTVELPNLSRSADDLALAVLTVEVDLQHPEPEPA
ncbi:hypothetical protein KBY72_13960 [Cyanobium sp. BA5m-21]|uniref:hypothetical protein n=1 Tax=unclassified Cyanobium TaxID=2627006 RepID=UPI0020CC71B2|nr:MULTISPECIES: hypothetical protein [unclassified Cyanobium]MCP9903113.1 hypothetical protein [Cyanobium sp. BA5m-10]MCP9908264.1 hypothetical protein [Cyanobium sp. BA5m-21]